MHEDRSLLGFSLYSLPCLLLAIFVLPQAVCSVTDVRHDTLTVCDGETVSFSWPCDLQYDVVKVMTLTFNGLKGEDQIMATIYSNGTVTVPEELMIRVRVRGTSGISLSRASILDSGIYLTSAVFHNGTVMKRHFTLNVHVPPLLIENLVTLSKMNVSENCQSITCGHVVFPGFPPVSFVWTMPKGLREGKSSEGVSIVQGCPLGAGRYICQLQGPALRCGRQRGVKATVSIPSRPVDPEAAREAAERAAEEERKELILIIVVPIVAVTFPLIILGLWVLRHLLSDCSRYKKMEPDQGVKNTGLKLVKQSSDVFSLITMAASGRLSATTSFDHPSPARHSSVTAPMSITSETAPLTAGADDEDEGGGKDDEEAVVIHSEDAPPSDDESQLITDPDSFKVNFADDASETRL